MPGPQGPAHRGWLGVVTGIRLIQMSTGGILVILISAVQLTITIISHHSVLVIKINVLQHNNVTWRVVYFNMLNTCKQKRHTCGGLRSRSWKSFNRAMTAVVVLIIPWVSWSGSSNNIGSGIPSELHQQPQQLLTTQQMSPSRPSWLHRQKDQGLSVK